MSEKNDLDISLSLSFKLSTTMGVTPRQAITALKITAGKITKPTKKAKDICVDLELKHWTKEEKTNE
jgi:hypothetical protein